MADLSSYIYIEANTVTAVGNIVADNLVGNTIIANTELSGDGGNLGNITGANVTGAVTYATTANAVAGANVSGVVANATYAVTAGTANAVAGANVSGVVANATYAVTAGTANSVVVANVSGIGNIATINLDGNVSNVLYGNGTFAAAPNGGGGSSYDNSNVATFLASYGSNTITTTGNVSVGNIIGNGQALRSIAGANVIGTVANATYAVTAGTANSVAAANISGTVNLANYATTANSVAAANISGTVANATYAVTSATANSVAGANVSGTVANATYATSAGTATTAGAVTTNAQPNITSVGTLTSLSATGNVTSGGLTVNGAGVVTGNLQIQGTLTYNNLTNLTTSNLVLGLGNNQTGVSVNGAGIVAGNTAEASFLYNYSSQTWDSNIGLSAVGNVTGAYIVGNGSRLSSLTGANVTGAVTYATTANSVAVANVSGIGNIATVNKDGNSSNILYGNGVFASAPVTYGNSNVATFLGSYGSNTITTTGNVSVGNIIGNGQALTGLTGANVSGQVNYSATANAVAGANVSGAVAYATTANAVAGANVSGQVGNSLVAGTVYTNAQPNITSVGTLTSLAVTGNITNGNVTGGNLVSANYLTGTLTTAAQPNITSTGTLTNLSVTGNVSAGNIIVNGQPTTYGVVSPEYINMTTSAAVNVAASGTDLTWDVNNGSSGITYSAGKFSLKAGKTYHVLAEIAMQNFSANGYLLVELVDGTTNARIGSQTLSIPYNTGYNEVNNPTLDIVYTPVANQDVKLRVTGGSSGLTAQLRSGGFTRMSMVQINPTIAVQATATGTVNNQYSGVTLTSNQVIGSPGTPTNIIFQNAIGTVPYNASTGIWTLTSGVTYNLSAVLAVTGASNYLGYQWVDSVSGTALSTALGFATLATTQVSSVPLSIVYTPNTNQTIALRNVNGQYASVIANYSWATVTQINQAFALNALDTMTTTGNVTVGGNLTVTGGIRKSARVLTATTTLTVADASGFIEFSSGSGAYTITLPNPTLAANSGIGYRFWQNTTDNITLSTPAGAFYGPSGSSASTKVLVQATTPYWDVWSDGYNWIVFGIKIA